MTNRPEQDETGKAEKQQQHYPEEKNRMDNEGGNNGLTGEEMDKEKDALEEEIPEGDTAAGMPGKNEDKQQ